MNPNIVSKHCLMHTYINPDLAVFSNFRFADVGAFMNYRVVSDMNTFKVDVVLYFAIFSEYRISEKIDVGPDNSSSANVDLGANIHIVSYIGAGGWLIVDDSSVPELLHSFFTHGILHNFARCFGEFRVALFSNDDNDFEKVRLWRLLYIIEKK